MGFKDILNWKKNNDQKLLKISGLEEFEELNSFIKKASKKQLTARDADGNSPLHIAVDAHARYGSDELYCITILLNCGFSPREKNRAGQTPIDIAREHSLFKVIVLFTEHEERQEITHYITLKEDETAVQPRSHIGELKKLNKENNTYELLCRGEVEISNCLTVSSMLNHMMTFKANCARELWDFNHIDKKTLQIVILDKEQGCCRYNNNDDNNDISYSDKLTDKDVHNQTGDDNTKDSRSLSVVLNDLSIKKDNTTATAREERRVQSKKNHYRSASNPVILGSQAIDISGNNTRTKYTNNNNNHNNNNNNNSNNNNNNNNNKNGNSNPGADYLSKMDMYTLSFESEDYCDIIFTKLQPFKKVDKKM